MASLKSQVWPLALSSRPPAQGVRLLPSPRTLQVRAREPPMAPTVTGARH